MKKIIIFIALSIFLFQASNVFAKESDFITKFNVKISNEDYKILSDLGYPQESIYNMTQSYFDYVIENKDTLVIQSIKKENEIKPFSMDDYPREGLYQAFNTFGGREQITSVNTSTYNGNKVYEVVNFVSWTQIPPVRDFDLNMITFDDFYVTPIRATLDGEQDVSYARCPNGHKEPNAIVYYNPNGNRVIYGAETVGFAMNLVNDYTGKCVNGIASMIKVKLDNSRSDVKNFDVTGSYLHMNTTLTAGEIAKAIAAAALTKNVSKGVIKLAQGLLDFKYDKGNITGIHVADARW